MNAMFLFLLTLFPLLYVLFSIVHTDSRKYHVVFFVGFLAAVLVCIYSAFFYTGSSYKGAGFFGNYCHFFLWQTFFPVVILCLAFYFCAGGNPEFRVSCFLPLLFSFYSVYLPYRVISGVVSFSLFDLFLKPIMYACMLLDFSLSASCLAHAIRYKKRARIAFFICMAALNLICPAVVETFWYTGQPSYVWLPGFFLVSGFQVVCFICMRHPSKCETFFSGFQFLRSGRKKS